ncbi:SDR family oxidoreductase [Chryseolinea lacunae]|uniref:SDR family oxidoreductase n=1 Tax=Chryseolinea lacunae TaxID=2801331 RepID=A0ABS1KYG8_9BACT|nr:SDR family oxidoreductase [Chryseolinea lacunae]MBL0744494.1 SDR family oxidoreductase [Chryseolinea lacunae]
MKRLANKTALITGGNSGIGFATAKDFIEEGATVVITARSQAAVDAAVKELGPQAKGIALDVADMTQVKSFGAKLKAVAPVVNAFFVNAGIAKFSSIEQADEQHFDEQFNVNVKGAYFSIQQVLPLMPEGSSIVLNTSINASIGMPNASVYSATKAAFLTLVRTLSAELLPRKIRVNAVSPGPVSTPLYTPDKMGLPGEQIQAIGEAIAGKIPLGRFGRPEEIARVVTFFASDDSSFVLGAELIVDGGMATL